MLRKWYDLVYNPQNGQTLTKKIMLVVLYDNMNMIEMEQFGEKLHVLISSHQLLQLV